MTWKLPRRGRHLESRRGRLTPITGGISAVWFVVLVVLYAVLAGHPAGRRGGVREATRDARSPTSGPAAGHSGAETGFVSRVFADTGRTWREVFLTRGGRYEEPTLVLFSGVVHSACGYAEPTVGPFYCPHDHQVYIDLSFCEDLRTRPGASHDLAEAYVIAHEVGHHVQDLLGISSRIHERQRRMSASGANGLGVRLELQADCLAGIWARHAVQVTHLLGPGDVDEALQAAAAVGDDRIQRASQGFAVPESFSHGTSAQRVFWFKRGYDSGSLDACDTFAVRKP
ncbi:MAG: neutral zinc metallopeptidase [Acidobacteria bacterium]|nr:neutral zinc metallopeptidase [Acidobacteriota bacterium]